MAIHNTYFTIWYSNVARCDLVQVNCHWFETHERVLVDTDKFRSIVKQSIVCKASSDSAWNESVLSIKERVSTKH